MTSFSTPSWPRARAPRERKGEPEGGIPRRIPGATDGPSGTRARRDRTEAIPALVGLVGHAGRPRRGRQQRLRVLVRDPERRSRTGSGRPRARRRLRSASAATTWRNEATTAPRETRPASTFDSAAVGAPSETSAFAPPASPSVSTARSALGDEAGQRSRRRRPVRSRDRTARRARGPLRRARGRGRGGRPPSSRPPRRRAGASRRSSASRGSASTSQAARIDSAPTYAPRNAACASSSSLALAADAVADFQVSPEALRQRGNVRAERLPVEVDREPLVHGLAVGGLGLGHPVRAARSGCGRTCRDLGRGGLTPR